LSHQNRDVVFREIMRKIFLITAAIAITMTASALGAQPSVAASAWDGLWAVDDKASHYADHSFTLTREADGMWRYDDGSSIFSFRVNGQPWPERLAPGFSVVASMEGDTLDIVERGYGRDMGRWRGVLSSDGNRLTGSDTRVYPDGRETVSPLFALRVGSGSGFGGTWKQPADVPSDTRSLSPSPSPKGAIVASPPHFVISTADDGTMMWFLPATGEIIRGRADGRFRSLLGPQQPSKRTFAWRWLGPRKLLFTCRDSGHVIETAVEEISPDGRTFTDTLWNAGHDDEKDVRVLVKQ
jgi:hypothetical protein